MVKTSDNLSQTKPLSLKKDEVFSWKGDGQIIVGYYLDEKAQIPTTAQNSGAVEKAGAPALPGQYYVKSYGSGSERFLSGNFRNFFLSDQL
mgnify:CR=1 FL=1